MPDFTVTEYAFISIAEHSEHKQSLGHIYIPESAFNALCELCANYSRHGVKVFELAGRRKLKLDQYVGMIETKCGTRIEILPKHIDYGDIDDPKILIEKERRLLQDMLEVSLHLPRREAGIANLKRFQQPLYEWIIQEFLNTLKKLVQQGLRFDYHRIQDEQKYLRGQLQHAQYMRQSPTKKHIFPIEHDVYEVNRPENRLIKTALEVICKSTKQAENWRLAQELRLMTKEIPVSTNIKQDFNLWRSGRLLKGYTQIKPWTELILSRYMPTSSHGDWKGISLLFPMEKLFEHYVAHYLARSFSPQEWHIRTQHSSAYICDHVAQDMFRLKPDILIEHKENGQKKVLDTKWKLLNENERAGRYGLKDADIQQMFAYSYFYLDHQDDVILIYPQYKMHQSHLPSFNFKIRNSVNARLWVLPFDMENKVLIGCENLSCKNGDFCSVVPHSLN